ncbi:MAG: Frizzy aggregation protein FrzB [Myxococcaceae bacterium]
MNLGGEAHIDLLLFEVGGQKYAAHAEQVRRVDRATADAFERRSLGPLRDGQRALVFECAEGEAQLRVDAVHGFRRVAVDQLRRMPASAQADACAVGLWLSDEQPLVLVDLMETRKGRHGSDAT